MGAVAAFLEQSQNSPTGTPEAMPVALRAIGDPTGTAATHGYLRDGEPVSSLRDGRDPHAANSGQRRSVAQSDVNGVCSPLDM